MDVKEYKIFHEEHMTNNTGASAGESFVLLSTFPFCVFLNSFLSLWIGRSFITEFLIIILPFIFNCTIWSNLNHIFFLLITFISIFVIIIQTDYNSIKTVLSKEVNNKNASITFYRGCTNFASALCILAVDFMIFPKRLAKTESFGFGFMDLGVGFFICSNGFVEKHKNTKLQFKKLLKTELILCTFGLLRVVSVKSIDYQEHVSEYGVHWNFFFTLALCRLISYFIILVTNNANPSFLSVAIGLIHQILLYMGLQKWVLSNTPRDSFWDANKEGLVSSLGYICLYFAASSIGKNILQSKNIVYKVLLKNLLWLCVLMWLGTLISVKLFDVSRRLINISYVFWVLALSVTEIFMFTILEICLLSFKKKTERSDFLILPSILECINAHALFFFILSNLLTGLINITFQTLLIGNLWSMMIIVSYMIILCTVTNFLYLKKDSFYYKFVRKKHSE